MRASTIVLGFVVSAAGCGAKSGLTVDVPPEVDSGLGFDTFPCRWSLTRDVEVVRGVSFDALSGAVQPARDEVAVLARSPSHEGSRWSGARLAIGDPPTLTAPVDMSDGGDIMGYPGGWAVLTDACAHDVYDDAFGFLRSDPVGGPSCTLEPATGSFDVTIYGPSGGVVLAERPPDGLGDGVRTTIFGGGSDLSRAVDIPPIVAVSRVGSALVGHYAMGGSQELAMSGAFDIARDDLRSGLVILHAAGDGFHVARVSTELGPLFLDELAGPRDLGASPPRGTIVTNETEALVPLRDGRIAVIPLSGSAVRFIGPVDDGGPPILMLVILRLGASTGGVAWVRQDGTDLSVRFRSLVCNR